MGNLWNIGNNRAYLKTPIMRKIDQEMINALKSGDDSFSKGNRLIERNEGGNIQVKFHGHTIAVFAGECLLINNCGYWTNTTKQILNEILLEFCDCWLFQKKFDWFVEHRYSNKRREYTGGAMLVDLSWIS